MARERWLALAVAGLVCGLGVSYWEWHFIAPVKLPQHVGRPNNDLYSIYYPAYAFAYRSSPLLPRWNPYQLAGTPFLANYNGGFLYPPNLLAAVVPVHLAIGYVSALHIALAGLLVFVCARALELVPVAAAIGAVGFMFNDYFLAEFVRPSYLAGLAWVPGVFLCAGRLFDRPGPWAGAVLGLVLCLQFLTGDAQIVCYAAYGLLVAGAAALAVRRPSPAFLGRLVGAASFAAVTAALLSAAQLAPTLEVVARAVRGFGGLTVEQTLPPGAMTVERIGEAAFGSGATLLLALLAFAAARRRAVVFPATVLIAFSLLFGLDTPVYRKLFYHLPGANFFRLPQEMLVVGAFALAMLAAVGVDECVAPASPAGRRVLLAALGLGILFITRAARPLVPYGVATAVAIAATALLRGRARVLSAWAMIAILLLDRFGRSGSTVMVPQHNDAAFFAPRPFVRFLREHAGPDRVLVVKNWQDRFPIMEKLGTLYGLAVVQDYEPLAPAAYHEFLRPLGDVNTDRPLFWGRFFPGPGHPAWRLLDMLAVRYVVVAPGVTWRPSSAERFTLVYDAPDARVYQNGMGLPRAQLVGETAIVPDPGAALATVQAPGFDPGHVAVVDRPIEWEGCEDGASLAPGIDFAAVSEEEVLLDVRTPRCAVLVLRDLAWPGWRVELDGRERPLYRVDYLFRGVAVGSGVHRVRFWYDPPSLRWGAGVTIATGLLLLVLASARLLSGCAGRRPPPVQDPAPRA